MFATFPTRVYRPHSPPLSCQSHIDSAGTRASDSNMSRVLRDASISGKTGESALQMVHTGLNVNEVHSVPCDNHGTDMPALLGWQGLYMY